MSVAPPQWSPWSVCCMPLATIGSGPQLRSCDYTGYYQCNSSVRIARPGTKEELVGIVQQSDLVKGVGVGHRSAQPLAPHAYFE